MIHHQHKFIFIHIPKCGGHSIEKIFDAWSRANNFFVGWNRQHFLLKDIIKENPKCKNYTKFTFIRNPFSRIISEYFYIKKTSNKQFNLSFKEFCLNLDDNLNEYCAPFHQLTLCDYVLNAPIDFVGRLENFQEDFNKVCDKIGIPRQKLPHKNESKHKHYTEYYDDETRRIVANRYARDIEYFGYKFGE